LVSAAPEGGAAARAQRPPLLAPLPRRFLSLVYETLLLAALLWCAALLFGAIEIEAASSHGRALFQAYLLLVTGTYFTWQWTHGGQTLPMKTWRLRLVSVSGGAIGARLAWLRYAIALAGTLAGGIGFLWALADRDRQFLHDRLAGTRVVRA
jgi:uncharacterized RDD family membrane protein YckC